MPLHTEYLKDNHRWWRIANPAWADPLDPTHAARHGGRWNPPASFPTLYLNADQVTARMNLRNFVAAWPYEPEDLRDDNGPTLVEVQLPRRQRVCDAHSRLGVVRAGLPPNYPQDENGRTVPHERCQPVGDRAHAAGLRGLHVRSAQSPDGAGRELAWFPASVRSRARAHRVLAFDQWFLG